MSATGNTVGTSMGWVSQHAEYPMTRVRGSWSMSDPMSERPKTTRAEDLLYGPDMAPVIRMVGTSVQHLHDALRVLGKMLDEAAEFDSKRGDVGRTNDSPEPQHVTLWRDLFGHLAPVHDTLMDAYRVSASTGVAVESQQGSRPDPESGAFLVPGFGSNDQSGPRGNTNLTREQQETRALADLRQAFWEAAQFHSTKHLEKFAHGVRQEIDSDEP